MKAFNLIKKPEAAEKESEVMNEDEEIYSTVR